MNFRNLILHSTLFILIVSNHLQADTSTFPDHMLTQYLKTAAENNPDLKSAFDQWKAALEVELEVKTLPDPQFTFAYFIEPIETRTGPQRALFALEQTVPWMGKLSLKGKQAIEEANIYRMRFEELKWKIFYEVKKYYYEYAYLTRAVQITQDTIDLLRYIEGVARNGYAAGNTSYADVIRIQVELGKLQDSFRTLEDYILPIVAKLNAAMYLPTKKRLPKPSLLIPCKLELSEKTLIEKMNKTNPSLQAVKYLEKKELYGIKLAKKEYYPDFTFGVESVLIGPARTPGIPDSGKNALLGKVALNIPIWIGKRKAGVNKAKDKRKAAREELKGLEETLSADLQLILYRYRDSLRKLNLYGETLIPKAEEALAVLLKAFETDATSYLDLIDALKTLLDLQLSYDRALADQSQVIAELETLLGAQVLCTWEKKQPQKSMLKN